MSMDIAAMLTGAGLSAGVGIIGKVLGFWKDSGVTEAQLQERLQVMKSEMAKAAESLAKTTDDLNRDLREALSEQRAVLIMVAKLQSGQDVINQVTSKTLDAIIAKADQRDRMIQETQGMIGQILQEVRHKV